MVLKLLKLQRWILLLTLILAACTSEAQTVYVTRTGAKYHNGSCSYLRQSKISIDLKKAKEQGYTACSVCKPSTKESSKNEPTGLKTQTPVRQQNQTTQTPAPQKKSEATAQCSAITKAGTRCKRTASSGGKCWQHQ
jgi:hypothetical protein